MSEQQIVVKIAADGSVSAETKNITGQNCLDYIGLLEELLDATTTASNYTADYQRADASLTASQDLRGDLHDQL